MKLGRRTPNSKSLSISQPPIAVSLESIPTSNSRGWSRIKEWLTWFMMMVMVFLPFMAFVIPASAAPDLFPSGNYCFCHTSGCQPQCYSPSCFSIPFQQSFLPLLVHQCITKPQIALPCAFKFLCWLECWDFLIWPAFWRGQHHPSTLSRQHSTDPCVLHSTIPSPQHKPFFFLITLVYCNNNSLRRWFFPSY